MLQILIAILIALGCNVNPNQTAEEIKATNSQEFKKATEIYNSGGYKMEDGGGVVIDQGGGD